MLSPSLYFENAFCINLHDSFNKQSNVQMITTVTILAAKVTFDEKEKDDVPLARGSYEERTVYSYEEPEVKTKDDIIDLTPGSKGGWNKKLNGKLEPNTKYKVGNHIYETDDLGRVCRVSGKLDRGKLGRNTHQQSKSVTLKGGTKGIDEGGHLIAHQFKGAGEQINYVPMLGILNQGKWKKMEQDWANALEGNPPPPKTVEVDIRIVYDGTNKRPTKFQIIYKIDGKKHIKKFPNN